MATVNLGSIKFKWKGTYNGATAYTIDDVVEYNGSSYICVSNSTGNLPTNATYFEQMSAKGTDGTNGTDGTDLTTTLTTQGDIVYRDASGLARLGAGTSGQVLQTNGTGANPSWGTVSSDMVKLATVSASSSSTLEIDGYYDDTTYNQYKIVFNNIRFSADTYVKFFIKRSTGTITSDIYTGHTKAVSVPQGDGTGYYYGFASSFYNVNYDGGIYLGYYALLGDDININSRGLVKTGTYNTLHGELNTVSPQATDSKKAWTGEIKYNMDNSEGWSEQAHALCCMFINDGNNAHTGFVMQPTSGNITSGTMTLYGLKK